MTPDLQQPRNGVPLPSATANTGAGSTDSILPVSVGALMKQYPRLRPAVVEGLLRSGEVANIVSASKVGKSWLAYGLALSVATGRKWLDTFPTEAGRVLLIDNELHRETLANRIPTVAGAMFIPAADYAKRLDVLPLRGRLTDYHGLENSLARLKQKYNLVVVDAHYRMLPFGMSENDNAAMAEVYNLIDRFAANTGAAWSLIHHSSKGFQGEKAVTDVGAGAGSMARAADTHLVLREHQEQDHAVLDAALRSWPRVEPLTLKWSFPLWLPTNADPKQLKGKLNRQQQQLAERDRAGREAICKAIEERIGATKREIRDCTGFSRDRVDRLLCQMKADQTVSTTSVIRKGNSCDLFNLR